MVLVPLLSVFGGVVVVLVAQRLRKWIDVHAQYNSALRLFDDASSKASFTASAQQLYKIAKRDAQYTHSTIRVLAIAVRERSERSREDWIGKLRKLAVSEPIKSSGRPDYTRWYGYSPRPRNPECAELVRLIIKLHKPHDCDDTDQSWLRRCRAWLGSHIHKMFSAKVSTNDPIELAFADLRDLAFRYFANLMNLDCNVNLDNADLRVKQEDREKVYKLLNEHRQKVRVNGARVSLNGAWLAAYGHPSSMADKDTKAKGETNFAVELAKREDPAGLFLVGDHSLGSLEGDPGQFEGVRIMGGPGVQLRNRRLLGVNFQHSLLMGADFSHSVLTKANFGFADITEARFKQVAHLCADQFINAKRTDADFLDSLFPDAPKQEADDTTQARA